VFNSNEDDRELGPSLGPYSYRAVLYWCHSACARWCPEVIINKMGHLKVSGLVG
jgi:hypothetical protein